MVTTPPGGRGLVVPPTASPQFGAKYREKVTVPVGLSPPVTVAWSPNGPPSGPLGVAVVLMFGVAFPDLPVSVTLAVTPGRTPLAVRAPVDRPGVDGAV